MILRIFFDGEVRGKTRVAWLVLAYADKALVGGRKDSASAPKPTGNYAEYRAFLEAIRLAQRLLVLHPKIIRFLSDSMLVVNQTKGFWQIGNEGRYLAVAKKAWKEYSSLAEKTTLEIEWLPRKENPAHKLMRRDLRTITQANVLEEDQPMAVS